MRILLISNIKVGISSQTIQHSINLLGLILSDHDIIVVVLVLLHDIMLRHANHKLLRSIGLIRKL